VELKEGVRWKLADKELLKLARMQKEFYLCSWNDWNPRSVTFLKASKDETILMPSV